MVMGRVSGLGWFRFDRQPIGFGCFGWFVQVWQRYRGQTALTPRPTPKVDLLADRGYATDVPAWPSSPQKRRQSS
jgi:hypothetical protein